MASSFSSLRKSLVVASLSACGLFAVGCAGTQQPSSDDSSFSTEPAAPAPRMSIEWREELDDQPVVDYRARQYASPTFERTAHQRTVLVGTDAGVLYRLRAGDGTVRWQKQLGASIHAQPVADADRVYVGTSDGTFYALDRSSGSVDWSLDNDREIESRAATGDGIVVYATNGGRLVGVDVSKGKPSWSYSRSTPKEFTIKGSGTPRIVDRTVYCGFADGTVAAIESQTGKKVWTSDVTGGETEFTDVDDPVVVRDDRVYAASYGAGVTALDRESGRRVWSRTFDDVSGITYAEDRLYVGIASGRIVSLTADNGETRWGFSTDGTFPAHLVPTAGYLFVSTSNGPLYILDRKTGYPLETWQPSNGVNTAVAFSERAGYLFSNKGYLYRFRIAY